MAENGPNLDAISKTIELQPQQDGLQPVAFQFSLRNETRQAEARPTVLVIPFG